MVESKPIASQNTEELEIMFWIINNSKYDKFRKLEGCEDLGDLTATVTDIEHIINLAKCFGVKDEYMFIDSEHNYQELKTTYLEILKNCRMLTS